MKNFNSEEYTDLSKAGMLAAESESAKGIGVLAERLVHGTLKYHYCPDDSFHEVKYKGFIADILTENNEKRPQITEIQTRQAYKLVRKLEAYGNDADVTVVLPIVAKKKIVWVSKETNEVDHISRTSRPKGIYHSLKEIYALRGFLNKPNITINVPLIEATEFRFLDGYGESKKKRATKYQITADGIISTFTLSSADDYADLLPDELGDEFTAAMFAEKTGITVADARYSLLALSAAGVIEECGKNGRVKLWKKILQKSV